MAITTALSDLDELVLQCRDDRARSLIAEAVACYRGGAYRAAIVATWVAVCFDLIDKLRELSLAGDKEAEGIVADVEKTRRTNNLSRALKLERELLGLARDKFELLSHVEFIDLERLQEDRNRCAHPSLISEDQPFTASGELARVHIYSAVNHLLQHPPVQGKHALDRLLREIGSEFFPDDVKKATASLSSGPLKRPRQSLVRNLVVVLVKDLLTAGTDYKQVFRARAALGAVKALHGSQFELSLKEKLPALVEGLHDKDLHLAVRFVCRFPECWSHLPAGSQHRLEAYVESLPAKDIDELEEILECPHLKRQGEVRARRITRAEATGMSFMFFAMPSAVVDRLIDLYLQSSNYAEANGFAKTVAEHVGNFSVAQQERLIKGIRANGEILHSFEVGTVIAALRKSEQIPPLRFEALLEEHGLEKYVLNDDIPF
ncbi:MAG TPA: hypothetical protein VFE23_10590 [Usitatibacter sp.]|jgi:hypothetical protein|nr:hypothetical protein [Usitatibacter sp.]